MRGTTDVNAETWDVLEERGPIHVTYLPDAPQSHRVLGQSKAEGVRAIVIPGVFALIGGVMVYNVLGKRKREKALRAYRRDRRGDRHRCRTGDHPSRRHTAVDAALSCSRSERRAANRLLSPHPQRSAGVAGGPDRNGPLRRANPARARLDR